MDKSKKVNKSINLFFKLNKNFKEVKTYEEATALIVFLKTNLSHFNVVIKEEVNEDIFSSDMIYQTVYLKNTNPHDRKNATMGCIKKITPCKRRY